MVTEAFAIGLTAIAASRAMLGRRPLTTRQDQLVMKFKDYRDAATADLAAQAAAGDALAQAARTKQAADGKVAISTPGFAAAIKRAGGEMIDPSTSPPTSYVSADGVNFTVATKPGIDDEAPAGPPAPAPAPVPVVDPPADPAAPPAS